MHGGNTRRFLCNILSISIVYIFLSVPVLAAPEISGITAPTTVSKFEKYEITFQVTNTVAQNLQMPFDPNPPTGIPDGYGINVNAEFSQDNFQTIIRQPAFYYQNYLDEIKSGKEWFYPTANFAWKVRFAPNSVGSWQYRLTAQDQSGSTVSPASEFSVSSSSNPGFIKVSSRDSRYFEFENGTYFPGLGYNMNYDQIDWVNPTLSNQSNFQIMGQNGIQFIRMWLSQWSIFGTTWNPWYSIRGDYDGQIPRAGLMIYGTNDPVSTQLALTYGENNGVKNSGNWFDACRFIGGFQAQPAVKQNTKYHIKIRYHAHGISGPRNSAFTNYGFVAKVQNPNDGNWHTSCYEPGAPQNGIPVTSYGHNSPDWTYLEGEWNSGNNNFLPIFYLTLENVNNLDATGGHAYAYIDTVSIAEDFGNNTYGPNIVTKPSMEHLKYFMERNAYAFDKVLNLAKQYNIYLRPVLMEKLDVIQSSLGLDGMPATYSQENMYGWMRTSGYVRWFQQAWWRYVQARWGYSTNIHSWELLNEANPSSGNHNALADEFGKFMHCRVFGNAVGAGDSAKCTYDHPNDHLVSTSTWSGWQPNLWNGVTYPNIDFADFHRYISKTASGWLDPNFYDSALSVYSNANSYGAKTINGVNKPTVRGETGFTDSGTEPGTNDLRADTQGGWLRHFLWGQIGPGGIYDSGNWYPNQHIYYRYNNVTYDFRPLFGAYYQFMKDIPLNNGYYVDAAATAPTTVRVWGQKDTTNNRAHLWIANAQWRWNAQNPTGITSTVSIGGFTPNSTVPIIYWNTQTGTVQTGTPTTVSTDGSGTISIQVTNLISDFAVKIGNYSSFQPTVTQTPASPTPTVAVKPGDTNSDNFVNGLDYVTWLSHFNQNVTGPAVGDFNNSGRVDGLDYVIWLNNFGK